MGLRANLVKMDKCGFEINGRDMGVEKTVEEGEEGAALVHNRWEEGQPRATCCWPRRP